MIKKYIKKPVEVEAIQLTEDNVNEGLDFMCCGDPFESCFEDTREEVASLIKTNDFYITVNETDVKVNFGDYIIKGHNNLFYKIPAKEFEATYQSVGDFIDLNKLKNYECFTKGAALENQLKKVFEENKEFILETVSKSLETKILTDEELIKNRENIISEGLDVMTSMYNYLIMLGLTKEDFEKHITKLNKYKETKYKR